MSEIIVTSVVSLVAFATAGMLVLSALGGLQITRRFNDGVMHWFFFALYASNGVMVLVSGRSFTALGGIESDSLSSSPLATWLIRLASLIALVAAADQIARRIPPTNRPGTERVVLALGLVTYWFCNTVVPAFFAANTAPLQSNWVYVPVLGVGLLCLSQVSAERCVMMVRNVLVTFCAISISLIPVKSNLVMQLDYTQSYLGIPRFAGLAPHAIAMGVVACVAVWLLLSYPMQRRWLNRLSFLICLVALGLAQSKAIWMSMILTAPILMFYRNRVPTFNTVSSRKYRTLAVVILVGAMLGVALVALYLMLGSFGDKLSRFLDSSQGAQLTSFTGRDRIWEVALGEWAKSPVFGYGMPLFGPEHRAQIAMSFATSGHNLFIDALARTGLVGFLSILFYLLILLYFGFKYAKESRGLTAVLVLSLWIRTISGVTLNATTLGIDAIPHFLLLVLISYGIAQRRGEKRAKSMTAAQDGRAAPMQPWRAA